MKVVLIFVFWAASCTILPVDPDAGLDEGTADDGSESDAGSAEGDEDGGCEADCPHALSGEVLLFVNSRLSDEDANWSRHLPLDEPGTFVGNALYLYDPTRQCDEGGNACRLVELGHLRLAENLGTISVADGSLEKLVVQDLAWHPELGLWGFSFDSQNDEWGIATIEVPDWSVGRQSIDLERYAVRPGDPEHPDTDPCYWQEGLSGLSFFGDDLLLGVRGAGGKGLDADGKLFRVDTSGMLQSGYCVYDGDISHDPHYYACDTLCFEWCDFGYRLGVAGDIESAADGARVRAWVSSEDPAVLPLDHDELYSCPAPDEGEVAPAVPDGIALDGVPAGDQIDALARVDGVLYGLTVLGQVYAIDEEASTIELHDDLAPLFPAQGLKLRGATRVVLPESGG